MLALPGKLEVRPAMYLTTYDGSLNATTIFGNFLWVIFQNNGFSAPTYINIGSANHYFSISAATRLVNKNLQFAHFSTDFDVENEKFLPHAAKSCICSKKGGIA